MKEEIIEKLKQFDSVPETRMSGVTWMVNKFKKKFDQDYHSKVKAVEYLEKEGKEVNRTNLINYQQYVIAQWNLKSSNSCDKGHIVHQYIEEKLGNFDEITKVEDSEHLDICNKFDHLYDKIGSKIENIGQEVNVFSEKLGLIGTIDGLFIRNSKLEIWDYKTNGKFRTDDDKSFNKLLPPFHKEDENELNIYSIQLALYKLILAEKGILVDGDNVILYLNKDECKIIKCKDYIGLLEIYFECDYYTKLKKRDLEYNI